MCMCTLPTILHTCCGLSDKTTKKVVINCNDPKQHLPHALFSCDFHLSSALISLLPTWPPDVGVARNDTTRTRKQGTRSHTATHHTRPMYSTRTHTEVCEGKVTQAVIWGWAAGGELLEREKRKWGEEQRKPERGFVMDRKWLPSIKPDIMTC